MGIKGRKRSRGGTSVRFPGTTATLTLSGDYQSAGGHPFGLLHCASTNRATIVLDVDSPVELFTDLWAEFELLDFGDALDIDGLTAVIDSAPAEGAYREWLAEGYGPREGACSIATRVAVTYAVMTKDRRRNVAEEAVEVGVRLPTLITSLSGLGLKARPMTSAEIIAAVGEIYREQHPATFADVLADESEQRRDRMIHDGLETASATVASKHLDVPTVEHLAMPTWAAPRRRVAITYRPILPPVDAQLLALGDELVGDFPDAEADETPGAAEFAPNRRRLARMGAIVSVTEPRHRGASLETIRAELPLAGRLAVRLGYDLQAALLAGSIGVGVSLPEHLTVADVPVAV